MPDGDEFQIAQLVREKFPFCPTFLSSVQQEDFDEAAKIFVQKVQVRPLHAMWRSGCAGDGRGRWNNARVYCWQCNY